MRIDLITLLREREIVHPSRITSTSISPGKMRIVVHGHPWWRDLPEPYEEQSIELTFEDVAEGMLYVQDAGVANNGWDSNEALEAFEVRPIAEFEWARPDVFSIYCSGPLKDPHRLYMLVHDFIVQTDACRSAEEFLNCFGRLSTFLDITASSSFLVACGPECIREIVCGELERQGVVHNVIEAMPPTPDRRLLVRWGDSHLVCGAAFAEFT